MIGLFWKLYLKTLCIGPFVSYLETSIVYDRFVTSHGIHTAENWQTRIVVSFDRSNEVRGLKFLSNYLQINSVKFNEQGAALVSGGYDRSVRAWDCRSNRFDPIQVLYTRLRLTVVIIVLCHIPNRCLFSLCRLPIYNTDRR
jgi:WD40 repeat protein